MKFGIDAIGFYTPGYFLDLEILAKANKTVLADDKSGFGIKRMSVLPPYEDVITMAANAVAELIDEPGFSEVAMIMFATESGVDCSKSAALYLHNFFGFTSQCRIIELKQACYGTTWGLQLAISWLKHNPGKKALLVASDHAVYQSGSQAELSGGCGAVAMLISANPRLFEIEATSGIYTAETMDFWHPVGLDYALVNGKLSCETYLDFLNKTWQQYQLLTGRKFTDHQRFCYHAPLTKLVEVAHRRLAKLSGIKYSREQAAEKVRSSLCYKQEVGNCYCASLYLSLLSLLDNDDSELTDKLIGLYSYGSGSTAEFFAARVIKGYKEHSRLFLHRQLLADRLELSLEQYRVFAKTWSSSLENLRLLPDIKNFSGRFFLKEIKNYRRFYEKVAAS